MMQGLGARLEWFDELREPEEVIDAEALTEEIAIEWAMMEALDKARAIHYGNVITGRCDE